ncbi:MAG: hypothetical protein MK100_05815 [Phycisphaerales bacterium]|nr:hypothetical protein [Phycisphaerales bacterium]
MNLALRLQEAIATDADSLGIISMESSRLLELCRTLMQRGDLTTAAAINVDAGNIIGLCAKLAASDDGLPQALTLPPSDTLNELILLPAIAADQSTSTRQWLTLNLGDAPLEMRLRAARDLRLAEPSNAVYVANHQSLETAAVSIWRSEVERCLDAEDAEAIQVLGKQLTAMGFLGGEGRQLLIKLEDAFHRLDRLHAHEEAHRIAIELHRAWAAMDLKSARALQAAWKSAADRSEDCDRLETRSVFAWIKEEDEIDAQRKRGMTAVADLVRALDELAPASAIERRFASLIAEGIPIPPPIRTRTAHRLSQIRHQRRRQFALAMAAIIALAFSVVTIWLVRAGSVERSQAIAAATTCIQNALNENRLADAVACWRQAELSGLTDEPSILAMEDRVRRAESSYEAKTQQGAAMLAAAEALIKDDISLLELTEAASLLDQADELLGELEQQAVSEARMRLRAIQRARNEEERILRLSELDAIDESLDSPRPTARDLEGWQSRADQLDQISAAIALLQNRNAVDQLDVATRLQRTQTKLDTQRQEAATRIDALETGKATLANLYQIPRSASEWSARWQTLLTDYPEAIPTMDRATWVAAAEAAEAASAVEDWAGRTARLNDAGLWGTGSRDVSTIGRVRTSLRSHLERFRGSTPYDQTAAHLLEIANAFADRLTFDKLVRSIEESNLLDLYRGVSDEGLVYLRSHEGGWRVLRSRQDLPVSPPNLDPLTGEETRILRGFANIEPPPGIAALQHAIDQRATVSIPPAPATADLLRAIEQSGENDELLLLAIYQAIWTAIAEADIPLPRDLAQSAAQWQSSLPATASSATSGDWIRLAARKGQEGPQSRSQIEIRRQATQAIGTVPQADDIDKLWAIESQLLQTQSEPRHIAGVLVPTDDLEDSRMHVRLASQASGELELLMRDGPDWVFVPLDAKTKDGEMVQPPPGLSDAPAIIFHKR